LQPNLKYTTNLVFPLVGSGNPNLAAVILEVTDPRVGEVIGHVPSASKQDVLASPESGLKIWKKTSTWARADILHVCASGMQNSCEEAATRITLETGKPIAQSRRD
jgi:succinate-semialdehyde dehydrogenase / glutarate-semialdehyde dehydrogenase